ncbi:MAG: zf-HC2 domain-containing protein [Acidobacteriota bacterium]
MQNINQRPVCHRAEDLVTYLYGEATAEEARDFSAHMQQCDACRAECTVFHQVHDSIVAWRNEAIGSVVQVSQSTSAANGGVATDEFVRHERQLSALAALREFFSVSPLWLRGATAFAGLLLCALIVFAVSRPWQQPVMTARDDDKKYTEEQFQQAVRKQVEQIAKSSEEKREEVITPAKDDVQPHTQFATRRLRPRTQPSNKLTREEREQLAADLGLIPRREEELPFVLPEGDEPNQ